MKSLMQIAIECNVMYNEIARCVKKNNILPTKIRRTNNYSLFLDKYQEELIHENLYFEGKINEITLQSKINFI